MKKFLTAITAAFVTAMGISSVPALSAGTPMDFTGDERVDVYDLICARKSGLEAEKLNAQAEIERAKGAAEAIRIENGSITPTYIQYLWVRQQSDLSDKTIIYIPTETNLPILEANRMNR